MKKLLIFAFVSLFLALADAVPTEAAVINKAAILKLVAEDLKVAGSPDAWIKVDSRPDLAVKHKIYEVTSKKFPLSGAGKPTKWLVEEISPGKYIVLATLGGVSKITPLSTSHKGYQDIQCTDKLGSFACIYGINGYESKL
jgi:hypothetical protein